MARGSGRPTSPTPPPSSGHGTNDRTRRSFGRGVPCACQKRRANFRHASTASAPLLQKNARGRPESAESARRQLRLQRMVEQVRRVDQRRRLVRDRPRQPRMGVPERRDADARDQIQIAIALAGEQARSPCRTRRPPARAGRPGGCAGRRGRSDRVSSSSASRELGRPASWSSWCPAPTRIRRRGRRRSESRRRRRRAPRGTRPASQPCRHARCRPRPSRGRRACRAARRWRRPRRTLLRSSPR